MPDGASVPVPGEGGGHATLKPLSFRLISQLNETAPTGRTMED